MCSQPELGPRAQAELGSATTSCPDDSSGSSNTVADLIIADCQWAYGAEGRRIDQADTLAVTLIPFCIAAAALIATILGKRHFTDDGMIMLYVAIGWLGLAIIFALMTRLTVKQPFRLVAGPRTVRAGVTLQSPRKSIERWEEVWPLLADSPNVSEDTARRHLVREWRDRVEAAGSIAHSKSLTVMLSVIFLTSGFFFILVIAYGQ
jgi:hypothetical protein